MKESNWDFDSFRHGFSKTRKIHLICKKNTKSRILDKPFEEFFM
jgi:hypothetical protein